MLHLMVAARVRLAPVSGMLLVALAVAGCITPIVKYGGETEGETGTRYSTQSEARQGSVTPS
jgi:hypothetical protein